MYLFPGMLHEYTMCSYYPKAKEKHTWYFGCTIPENSQSLKSDRPAYSDRTLCVCFLAKGMLLGFAGLQGIC